MKLKIIYCKYLPPKNYVAMTILFWMLVRKNSKISKYTENHENIHLQQEIELAILYIILYVIMILFGISYLWAILVIFIYYIIYSIEYLIRLILYRNHKKAYMNISFEQEAYLNSSNFNYLENRKHFSWIKYLFKKNF